MYVEESPGFFLRIFLYIKIPSSRADPHDVLIIHLFPYNDHSQFPTCRIQSLEGKLNLLPKTREEVNFLIGFQSPVLPRGLSWRKLAVVAWAEPRHQNVGGWFCEVCWWSTEIAGFYLCECVCSDWALWSGLKKPIKCEKTVVIRWATYPSCLARCSTTTIKHLVYLRARGSTSLRLYTAACKTLPWHRWFAFCISSWFGLSSPSIITAVDLPLVW